MATGNGAYILHSLLAQNLSSYRIKGYSPYRTFFPPSLIPLRSMLQNAELVHTVPDYGWIFKKRDIPLVVTFHNYVIDDYMKPFSTVWQKIHYKTDLRYNIGRSLKVADCVTSVSKYTAELVKRDIGYKGDIRVIHNGIDTQMFRPVKKNPDPDIKILFSGNLTRRKGAHLLHAIAEQVKTDVTILYTSGLRTHDALKKHSKMKNIGMIPYNKMPEIYQDADILLFPTIREGFGLCVAEAMACGLPVVATNCSSIPELVVDGEGGFLCEPENVNDFANKIDILASSVKLRQEMGAFNRVRAEERFTIERMVENYKELFESVC